MDANSTSRDDLVDDIERVREVRDDLGASMVQLERHVREMHSDVVGRIDQLALRIRTLEQRNLRGQLIDDGTAAARVYALNERRPFAHAMPMGLGGTTTLGRLRLYGAVGLGLTLCMAAVCVVLWLNFGIDRTFTAFGDGFERGNWAAWSAVRTGGGGTARVQNNNVQGGWYAAELAALSRPGSYAYARKYLASPQTNLTVGADFRVMAEGAQGGNVPLLQLYDARGTRLVNLYRQNHWGYLWVQHSGSYQRTRSKVPLNTWTHVELHVVSAGKGASTVEVSVYGVPVYQTRTASLGRSAILALQIGNAVPSQRFALVIDNIAVRARRASLL
jgi:hypothetical protein